jgi:hypothetical protein
MLTLTNKKKQTVFATGIHFVNNILYVSLSDCRGICLTIDQIDQIDWLDWLAKATPGQQASWSIESGGFAIYWKDLDDGIEVCHLLNIQPLSRSLKTLVSNFKYQ